MELLNFLPDMFSDSLAIQEFIGYSQTREMPQPLSTLAALAEDPGSVPSTYMVAYNYP